MLKNITKREEQKHEDIGVNLKNANVKKLTDQKVKGTVKG